MTATVRGRATRYKGIPMRSRFEAGYAAWLDMWGATWEYEPECFADENGQYLPDFLVRDVPLEDDRVEVYLELKPPPFVSEPGFAERFHTLRGRMMVIPKEGTVRAVTGCFDTEGLVLAEIYSGLYLRWVMGREGRLELAFDVHPCGPFGRNYWNPGAGS